jgi:hypothetical protein
MLISKDVYKGVLVGGEKMSFKLEESSINLVFWIYLIFILKGYLRSINFF